MNLENAIVKIQKTKAKELVDCKNESAASLTFNQYDDTGRCRGLPRKPTLSDIAVHVLQHEKKTNSTYMDTGFVFPVSNVCEQAGSKDKRAVTAHRKAMSPVRFEQKMFLLRNRDLWSLSDINELL